MQNGGQTEMKASELLRKAKERIGMPELWFKGNYWPGAYGRRGKAPDGAPCCMIGAIVTVSTVDQRNKLALVSYLARGIRKCISSYNDNPLTTHSDVMALFDRAIALAEQDEANV